MRLEVYLKTIVSMEFEKKKNCHRPILIESLQVKRIEYDCLFSEYPDIISVHFYLFCFVKKATYIFCAKSHPEI